MKRLQTFALTLCLALSLCAPAFAVGGSMDNFQKTDTYQNQFSDVEASYWATPSIRLCYEYGLMKGSSPTRFNPKGDLTVAEAIVMADRIHQIYTTGESTLTNGTPWYQPYVDYAVQNEIIAEGEFSDYTAKATRAQMAYLFCNALPASTLPGINGVQSLPDVADSTPYAEQIMTLYQAGVLTGSDIYGTFHPGNNIVRAEAAAILSRMALPAQRQTVVLMKAVSWGSDVVLAVPQTAREESMGNMHSYLSDQDRAGAIVSYDEDPNYQGLRISLLTQAEMNSILTQSFASTGLTLAGAQSTLVTFGAIQAYRTTGTLTNGADRADCVIYTYISGIKMNMLALLSYDNQTMLKNMANGLRVSGCAPAPKL